MFGNQAILNSIIAKDKDCPVKDFTDPLKVIQIMMDEQFKELGRQYQFCEHPVITVPYLGNWGVRNSQLRKYIRDNIKYLRKIRNRLVILKESKGFNPENSLTVMLERDLVLKTRVAWKQLDALRHTWIVRQDRYLERKSINAQMSNIVDNLEQ
jgi:hypothetical protein